MKDKLLKILEAALNNSEMVLNGSVIASENSYFPYQGVSDIKYKNKYIYQYNFGEIIYSISSYYKYKEIKNIEASFNNGYINIRIKPLNEITTTDITIEGSRKGKLEQFLKGILGNPKGLKKLKKEPIILNAKLNTYD